MRVPTKKCVQLRKSLSLGPASSPALCCGAELPPPSASAGARGARQALSAGTLPDPISAADFRRAAALADVPVLGLAPAGSRAALPSAAAPCPFRPRAPSGPVSLQAWCPFSGASWGAPQLPGHGLRQERALGCAEHPGTRCASRTPPIYRHKSFTYHKERFSFASQICKPLYSSPGF